ncbi:hypothetical protein SAMCCGM7_pC0814 (plasmid) [Sinorhizobium americanum CCGM7]|nr:hypothetical protein SAMCCGM7_pC0814 [Sinorhizobium americanum CCGM7]
MATSTSMWQTATEVSRPEGNQQRLEREIARLAAINGGADDR